MKKAVTLVSSLIFAVTAFAQTPSPDQVLLRALDGVKSYQAKFTQRIRDTNGDRLSQTKGEMRISRPGKFYWKSEAPDPILVVADGRHLWTYDIELAQITKQDQHTALANSPAALLAGQMASLTKDYTIDFATQSCRAKEQCFELRPKGESAQVSYILMAFANNKLVEIRMKNALGQQVDTRFMQVKTNQPIDKKSFEFHTPKGVDVIEAGN